MHKNNVTRLEPDLLQAFLAYFLHKNGGPVEITADALDAMADAMADEDDYEVIYEMHPERGSFTLKMVKSD